jgi:hypothetical protein
MRPHGGSRPPLRWNPRPIKDRFDGSWWPQSRDLPAELPALVEGLATRLGHVAVLTFAVGSWDPAPPQVELDGRAVRLEGLHDQDDNVVVVSGHGRCLTLRAVFPRGQSGNEAGTHRTRPRVRTRLSHRERG